MEVEVEVEVEVGASMVRISIGGSTLLLPSSCRALTGGKRIFWSRRYALERLNMLQICNCICRDCFLRCVVHAFCQPLSMQRRQQQQQRQQQQRSSSRTAVGNTAASSKRG